MKKSLLYTATGDAGTTSLVGGKRVKKTCSRLEAYGTVDELNSNIGLLEATWREKVDDTPAVVALLEDIQNRLFDIGSYLATDGGAELNCRGVDEAEVKRLEESIDAIDGYVPPINSFILPGGSHVAAIAHVARSVARRAERRIFALVDEGIVIDPAVLGYMNRLSDLLFVLARLANYRLGVTDRPWCQ
ncbi:MAG: cob(I)yrinic acid a,c-diamide adenosyltransferase [Muribaculaceae bacterium]|nr:cob(I)yrinic acid a,c-diamide adenosyltransferase [Muribaculaceae bacterium]